MSPVEELLLQWADSERTHISFVSPFERGEATWKR